jgi:hypothetical protein
MIATGALVLAPAALSARRHMLRHLAFSALLAACILVPLIVLLETNRGTTTVTLFHYPGAMATGIRFPNRKIWLVWDPARKSRTSLDRVSSSWLLRNTAFGSFDAVVMTNWTSDAVHELDPLFQYCRPRMVLCCSPIRCSREREDFLGFLDEYTLDLIESDGHMRIVPMARCTVAFTSAPVPPASKHGLHIRIDGNGVRIASSPSTSPMQPAEYINLTNGGVTGTAIPPSLEFAQEGIRKLKLRATGALELKVDTRKEAHWTIRAPWVSSMYFP